MFADQAFQFSVPADAESGNYVTEAKVIDNIRKIELLLKDSLKVS